MATVEGKMPEKISRDLQFATQKMQAKAARTTPFTHNFRFLRAKRECPRLGTPCEALTAGADGSGLSIIRTAPKNSWGGNRYMSKAIEILMLADRPADSLLPLRMGHSLPLLPVANKPIVEHLLETIALHAAHAPANVLACVGPEDTAAQDYLNNWAWPDVSVIVHDQPPRFVDRPTLVLRADIFPAPLQLGAALMQVLTDGELKTDLSRFGIEWLEAGAAVPAFALPDLDDEALEQFLPDIMSYHRLAIAAARGAVAGLNPGGWLEDDGLRAGLGARIKTRRAIGPHVEVGANACVEHDVLLGGNIVIGEGAHVARGAYLENAIVLPNTYIGPGLRLKDTVVSGDWVCRVESGVIELATDPREIGRLTA